MSSDLLLEIGAEEIPSSLVERGRRQLVAGMEEALKRARLPYDSVRAFSTPRRLAVVISQVAGVQTPELLEIKGPSVKVAYDEKGQPTRAATGFAASQGVELDSLQERETDGGAYVYAVKQADEAPAMSVLPVLCTEVVDGISFPKSMRWGSGSKKFARPIRWLCAMYGDELVDFHIEQVRSGKLSQGHRLLSPGYFEVSSPKSYVDELRDKKVYCDPEERKALVLQEIESAAGAGGGKPFINPDVLGEVVNLVEHPQGLMGAFAPEFLTIPKEVIKTAMQSHQRYFPIESADGDLLPLFIVVQNGDPAFGERIKHGHERVLKARLADGAFFFMEDTKTSLESKVGQLSGVVFQAKLGSVLDKVGRVEKMAGILAEKVGLSPKDSADLSRAAKLCKADLVTAMVGEFPELQGVVGREYARVDMEKNAVAEAIYEHYLPRFATDELPVTAIGRILSVADKMDSVSGFFAVGLKPSGSEDPYSLRRQSQGIVLITLEAGWDISLGELIDDALGIYAAEGIVADTEASAELKAFFAARLGKHLVSSGYTVEAVSAVQAAGYDRMGDMVPRLEALSKDWTGETLMDAKLAFTRCENLADDSAGLEVVESLFRHESERELYRETEKAYKLIMGLVDKGDFDAALEVMAKLRANIDSFFDAVLVMEEDRAVRANRLALLNRCVRIGRTVCDFSKIP